MFPSVAVAPELIRMIRTEPRRKPRKEIIKLSMRVSFDKICSFGGLVEKHVLRNRFILKFRMKAVFHPNPPFHHTNWDGIHPSHVHHYAKYEVTTKPLRSCYQTATTLL